MQEQLGFGGEVIIDDIVQERDVDTASCHVRHQQHHCFAMDKASNVDLSGRLVQSAVYVRTLNSLWSQQLAIKNTKSEHKQINQ